VVSNISVLIVVPSKEKPKVIMQHPKERQAESERLFKILEKIVKQD
jgi:hypothetical protein